MYIFGNDYDTIDGTAVRDYTHVCDIASAHIKTFEYMIKNNKNVICNIGTGKGYSIKELISIIENISNKKLNIEIKERRSGDSGFMVCSNEFAKNTINWEPKYNIYDIIRTSYEWYNVYLPLITDKLHLENNVIEDI
jgi:UDP-glucose 4-epimerase